MARDIQPHELRREFDKAVKTALAQTAGKLGAEFTKQISDVKWDWPNKTLRKNGQEVTAPRDIVDLGNLRSSQRRQNVSPTAVEWTWHVDYSAVVHEGAALKNGTALPKRPWTKDAEKEVKPLKDFADRLRRELDG
tara:strand:- start:115 stop:522 length:408 start_codon:yes stop_codon:yes gene_type:complete